MKYMGSKRRIVGDILPIMLDKEHSTFVDAFCGGCNVITHVPTSYRRIANDKNKYLIAMWKMLQLGAEFPHKIDRDLYNLARDCYHGKITSIPDADVGWIGFMASFNGRFFDGGYSGHNILEKDGRTRDYISRTIENIERDVPLCGGGWSFTLAATTSWRYPTRASCIATFPIRTQSNTVTADISTTTSFMLGASKWQARGTRCT